MKTLTQDTPTAEEYLQSKQGPLFRPFFTLIEAMNACGETEAKKGLNELLAEGRIKKAKGANGVIIELIRDKWKIY